MEVTLSEVTVVEETQGHLAGVRQVNLAAFATPAEAILVDRLRARGALLVSLVALLRDMVVGHIAFSPVSIQDASTSPNGAGLGPMAVLPEHQRCGIGSLLVARGLELCTVRGSAFVVVLGHSRYYPRFGFRPASKFGLNCKWPVPDDTFMAREVTPGALFGLEGVVSYAPEFDDV